MATDEKEIRALLERYFDGESTLEQERLLREYFTGTKHTPGDLMYARAMFAQFSEAAAEKCPENPSAMRATEADGSSPAGYPAPSATPVSTTPLRPAAGLRRKMLYVLSSAAALLAFGLVVTAVLQDRGIAPLVVYCYVDGTAVTDPEQAMAYARQTMELLSESLVMPAQSLAPVKELGETMKEIENMLNIE